MSDQNLSLKHATKLCRACRNVTKNPFIINNLYDLLEKTISNLQLENWPHLIWNVDISGLPSEPKNVLCHRRGKRPCKLSQVQIGTI